MTKKRWTIEDALDPKSDFWIYSEEELYEWLDAQPNKDQDKAFKNLEEWISDGTIKLDEPGLTQNHPDWKSINPQHTSELKSMIESDCISVTMINGMVALSAMNLEKLREMKLLMVEHGNRFVEYRYRLNKKEEKVHTYIFIIDN
jgi:hypothetical protein